MFRGVVIEDNSDLEVEQPKIAPPYQDQVNASIIVCETSHRILNLNLNMIFISSKCCDFFI